MDFKQSQTHIECCAVRTLALIHHLGQRTLVTHRALKDMF